MGTIQFVDGLRELILLNLRPEFSMIADIAPQRINHPTDEIIILCIHSADPRWQGVLEEINLYHGSQEYVEILGEKITVSAILRSDIHYLLPTLSEELNSHASGTMTALILADGGHLIYEIPPSVQH